MAQEMHRWILDKSPVLNFSVRLLVVTFFHVPEADALLNMVFYLSLLQLDNNSCGREVNFFVFLDFTETFSGEA